MYSLYMSFLVAAVGFLAVVSPAAQESSAPTPSVAPAADSPTDALGRETLARGLAWLRANQREDGSWSAPNFPGLSALGLWAAARAKDPAMTETVERAATYVASFAQPDGGIYKPPVPGRRGTGGLSTYNTAICMMALYQVDPRKYADIILKAREYVAGSQLVGDSDGPGATTGVSAGGFGYNRPPSAEERARRAAVAAKMGPLAPRRGAGGPPSDRPDLSNTGWALMAMRMTESLEDERPVGEKRADIDWNAALRFVDSMQNRDTGDPDLDGSFGYEKGGERDGRAPAGPDAKVSLRGFGSMTYDGLEAMIYAKVDRTDPRVRSAAAWAARHWTVDENPGFGQRGLYYYYAILSKSLALFTRGTPFVGADGTPVDWRGDLVRKLAAAQASDGSWSNDDNTFWENDTALVTAYSLLSLEAVLEAAP